MLPMVSSPWGSLSASCDLTPRAMACRHVRCPPLFMAHTGGGDHVPASQGVHTGALPEPVLDLAQAEHPIPHERPGDDCAVPVPGRDAYDLEAHVLRGRDDDRSGQRETLSQRQLGVTSPRREVEDQCVQLAPLHSVDERSSEACPPSAHAGWRGCRRQSACPRLKDQAQPKARPDRRFPILRRPRRSPLCACTGRSSPS